MTREFDHPPRAFISYSWDDAGHKEWVRQLATRLRTDGVDVTLDLWNATPGDQIPAFMERAVRENDFVIPVCTHRFKEKSDGRAGGVGYEGDILAAYVFTAGDEKKFIPVLRSGIWSESAPSSLLGRYYIDLSGDPYSDSNYRDLLKTLHGARESAPPVGPRPIFDSPKKQGVRSNPTSVTPQASSTKPQARSAVGPSKDLKKTCFVVMGFGTKTDLATGRAIDLDKCYKLLIKPVVEKRGIYCARADEITHSGVIDVPMYQQLLSADLVIADISTANANAIYELGIRHALKPYNTIVISENRLKYPFDLNHILITSYTYLDGGGIDFEEVMRFQEVLGKMIDEILKEPRLDSPVYTYLCDLRPPELLEHVVTAIHEVEALSGIALEEAGAGQSAGDTQRNDSLVSSSIADRPEDRTLSELKDMGEQAIAFGDFATAKERFVTALRMREFTLDNAGNSPTPDPYLTRRLALATYKTPQRDKTSMVRSLYEALAVLEPLKPAESNDPETIKLVGAIEMQLFENDEGVEHLARAIDYYERGYFLRDDAHTGISLAYLLNVRVDTLLDATEQERIADMVSANRIRRKVLILCGRDQEIIRNRRIRRVEAERTNQQGSALFREADQMSDDESTFRCIATKAEAHFGLGEASIYESTRKFALSLSQQPDQLTVESFHDQIRRLGSLLEKHGHLLDPPWPKTMAAKATKK